MTKKKKDEFDEFVFEEEPENKEEIIENVLENLEEMVQEKPLKPFITDEYREEVKLKKSCFRITQINDNYIIAHNESKGNIWVRTSDISNPAIGKEIYR